MCCSLDSFDRGGGMARRGWVTAGQRETHFQNVFQYFRTDMIWQANNKTQMWREFVSMNAKADQAKSLLGVYESTVYVLLRPFFLDRTFF